MVIRGMPPGGVGKSPVCDAPVCLAVQPALWVNFLTPSGRHSVPVETLPFSAQNTVPPSRQVKLCPFHVVEQALVSSLRQTSVRKQSIQLQLFFIMHGNFTGTVHGSVRSKPVYMPRREGWGGKPFSATAPSGIYDLVVLLRVSPPPLL